MVTIISGGSHSSRERLFIDRIKAAAEGGGQVLVIIPDQFSFEYDKKLYEAMGARLFNSIQTAGFNRLSELTEKLYGGSSKENADENVKAVLMYKAVRRLKETRDVRFYKRNLEKGSFIAEINNLVSQFRESGVTPEALQLAAEAQTGSLAMKLYDLSRLYGFYMDELENAGMQDSLSAVARSVRQARENGFFKGMSVFVDAFNDLTYDELKMLDVCISQCRELTVSLVIDEKCVDTYSNHPFADTIKTRQQLIELAADHNYKAKLISADNSLTLSGELAYLGENIFNTCKKPFEGKCQSVSIVSASDIYEESEYVSAKICELVREKGYRFNEIAILTRDMKQCAAVFEGTFERYEIPCFVDGSDSVSASSLVRYLNSIFKCLLTRQYSTDNIMKYIKSPLCEMINIQISDLEDYCVKWNVDGDMWLTDFTVSNGMSEKQLEAVNSSRRSIIEPFERFKGKIIGKVTAGNICRALYDLLSEVKLSQQMYSVVKKAGASSNETQLEMARGLKQLWNSVLSAIKAIYDCMGSDVISLRQFYELFKIMLSQLSISRPPQKLDCVRICDPGHSRLDGVRAVFAVEVNDGIFPATVSNSGLITENEKQLLLSNDIKIVQSARKAFQSEKLVCYNALTLADEELYMLYSESDLVGKAKRPSSLVGEVVSMFGSGIIKKAQNESLDFYCTSFRTAYYKYMEHSRDKTVETESVKAVLSLSREYSEKLNRGVELRENGDYRLSEKAAHELFFNEEPKQVSPTALDDYYKCPFRYYCKSGLGLRVVKANEFNGVNKGILIHQLLEKIIGSKDENGKVSFNEDFLKLTDDEIRNFIHENITQFINEQMGGSFGKSPSFAYIQQTLEDKAFHIVKFTQSELCHSKFRPALLEYRIERTENEDRLVLDVNGRDKIVLIGTIDRVDIYEDENGERYVRIIDYKTGKITLKYSHLYNGLNLQMFVYLTALLESKNPVNMDGHLKQASVIYYSLGSSPAYNKESASADADKKAETSRLAAFKPIGRTVDDKNVTDAFNTTDNFAYAPFKMMKNGNTDSLVTASYFTKLRKFAVDKVVEFGKNICSGKIEARPVGDACNSCDYREICGRVNQKDVIDVDDKIYEEMLEQQLAEGREEE